MKNDSYSRGAVILHWILAISIFFLFLSSWWMLGLPLPSDELRFREFPFQLHKNIGLTLVVLLIALLVVRLRRRPAPLTSAAGDSWMNRAAFAGHVLLYVLIVVVCVSGYLSSAHTRWDTVVWWLVRLPRIAEADEEMNEFYSDIHLWSAWALLGLVVLHIAGALYHALRNDGVVKRMLRW